MQLQIQGREIPLDGLHPGSMYYVATQVDVSSCREEAQKWLGWRLHSHPFSQDGQRKKDEETWQWMRVVADWSYDERQYFWQNHANEYQGFFTDTTGPVHQFTVGPSCWLPNIQTHKALLGSPHLLTCKLLKPLINHLILHYVQLIIIIIKLIRRHLQGLSDAIQNYITVK